MCGWRAWLVVKLHDLLRCSGICIGGFGMNCAGLRETRLVMVDMDGRKHMGNAADDSEMRVIDKGVR